MLHQAFQGVHDTPKDSAVFKPLGCSPCFTLGFISAPPPQPPAVSDSTLSCRHFLQMSCSSWPESLCKRCSFCFQHSCSLPTSADPSSLSLAVTFSSKPPLIPPPHFQSVNALKWMMYWSVPHQTTSNPRAGLRYCSIGSPALSLVLSM